MAHTDRTRLILQTMEKLGSLLLLEQADADRTDGADPLRAPPRPRPPERPLRAARDLEPLAKQEFAVPAPESLSTEKKGGCGRERSLTTGRVASGPLAECDCGLRAQHFK